MTRAAGAVPRSVLARVSDNPVLALWLTAVWVGLWGDLSAANLLGGLAVAALLLVLLPLPTLPDQGRVRLLPLLRFGLFFLAELVRASLLVVRQVLVLRRPLQQAVIALPVPGASDRLLTTVANAISLTPGTLTLEVDRDRGLLYVHVLDVSGPGGVASARRSVERLRDLAADAVGPAATRTPPRPGGAA